MASLKIADTEFLSDIIENGLRERIRESLREEFKKIADPVIDAAVESACKEFEARVIALRDLALDQVAIRYSVKRVRND